MKKLFVALSAIVLLFLIGCNEKNLKNNLSGSWKMSKYVGNSIDSTKHFDTTFIDFTWTFNADQTFSKSWKSRQYLRSASYDTTFGVDPSGNPIITNIDTNYSFNPYYTDHSNAGRWVLFNGNDYVQLRDSANAPAMDYRIESHTSKNLVLTRGNQEMHLGAK